MVYRLSIRTLGLWIMGIAAFGFALHRGVRIAEPSIWEYTTSYITYPFIRASHAITTPITDWLHERELAHDLLVRHRELLDAYDDLQRDYIAARALSDTYADVEELIAFNKEHTEDQGHIAQIMLRHISDQAHYFVVDAGSHHGIEPDMVALYKNCIVGRVTHVYPYYCKVVLVTDVLCKVSAYCSETQAIGIHEGLNNTNATTLRHVSHLATMKEGDLILSSGEGLIFPRGYALGTVESFTHDGLLYSISVKPLLDFNTLRYCTLVRRGASSASDEISSEIPPVE